MIQHKARMNSLTRKQWRQKGRSRVQYHFESLRVLMRWQGEQTNLMVEFTTCVVRTRPGCITVNKKHVFQQSLDTVRTLSWCFALFLITFFGPLVFEFDLKIILGSECNFPPRNESWKCWEKANGLSGAAYVKQVVMHSPLFSSLKDSS